jgi:hypothetical protein
MANLVIKNNSTVAEICGIFITADNGPVANYSGRIPAGRCVSFQLVQGAYDVTVIPAPPPNLTGQNKPKSRIVQIGGNDKEEVFSF